MKRFLLKITKYAVVYGLVLICGLIGFHKSEVVREYLSRSYYMGYLNTLRQVKSKANEQKILFLGGSNLGFGLNSERIENTLNVSTFNLGVQAGFGLKRSIEDVQSFIGPKDIIILSPEYSNIEDPHRYDMDKHYLDFLKIGLNAVVDFETFVAYLSFLQISLKGIALDPQRKNGYNLGWFNSNGDVIGHHDKKPKPISVLYEGYLDLSGAETRKFIDSLLIDKNYFFIPPVTNENRFTTVELNKINKDFKKAFTNHYPINIFDMVYESDCFYDTAYHLNISCKEDRTNKIIAFLKTVISK